MDRTEKLFWVAALGWPILAALIQLDYGFALLPFCFFCGIGVLHGMFTRDFHQVLQLLGAMAVFFMLTSLLYSLFGLPSGRVDQWDKSIQ